MWLAPELAALASPGFAGELELDAIRIVHSLVQTTWNKIEVRFALVALSSLVLVALVALAVNATLIA